MSEDLYSVNVSSLQVRKLPSEPSKINVKRGTVVNIGSEKKQYRKEDWVMITTVSKPIISGYVQKKYLVKI